MTKEQELIERKGGELAFSVHESIVKLKRNMGVAFLRLGELLKKVKDGKLYERLDYPTFRDYLHSPEVGINWRTGYYYIEIWEMFIERLGYTPEFLIGYSYDRLRKLLPIVKKENEAGAKEIMEQAKELRWVDFERQFKDEKKQEKFKDRLAPPEYFRCDECGKRNIVVPVEECCPKWLKEFTRVAKKLGT